MLWRTYALFFLCGLFPLAAFDLAPNQPHPVTLHASISGEARLTFSIEVEQFSFATPSFLFVQVKKNRYILPLVKGKGLHNYSMLLGKLSKGDFSITLSLRGNTLVHIDGIEVRMMQPEWLEYETIASAPIVVAPSLDTDIPILLFVQKKKKEGIITLTYQIIFSNEDAGTPTFLLLAWYGRTTDIEWIYEVQKDKENHILKETLQTKGHRTVLFKGRKRGGHPLLFVCTKNGMVCDTGEEGYAFSLAPLAQHPTPHTREEMMDKNPWTYQVMCAELEREKKISTLPFPKPPLSAHPSRYIYLEYKVQRNQKARHYAFVQLDNGKRYTSHFKQRAMAQKGNGRFRSAILLPPNTPQKSIRTVGIGFIGKKDQIHLVTLLHAFALNTQCRPKPPLIRNPAPSFCTKSCSRTLP